MEIGSSVSVIILSFNRPEMLRASMEAVSAQTYPPLEVIVVDNLSPRSPQVHQVMKDFPESRFLPQTENLGFTGGMNTGLAAAAGEYVLLTEDDVVLAPDYLDRVMAVAESRDDAGIISGIQYNRTAGTVRCAGGMCRLEGQYRITLLHENAATPPVVDIYPVDFIIGSMMLARTDLLRRLGGFRADFSMYCEDIELCARITRCGLKMLIASGARADHFEPPSAPGATPEWIREQAYRNFIAMYLLHAPLKVFPQFAFRYGLRAVARHLFSDPRQALRVARAWARISFRLPWLVRDRHLAHRLGPLRPNRRGIDVIPDKGAELAHQ